MADGDMTPAAIHVVLTRVVRQQDEFDARLRRIEAALGLAALPMQVMQPQQMPLPLPLPLQPQPETAAAAASPQPPAAAASPQPSAAAAAASPQPVAAAAAAAASPPPQPLPPDAHHVPPPPSTGFEARVGLQWLNRIGVVTLILGMGFAFKTATDNGWIGPTARVVLGVLAAAGSLGAGDRLRARGHAVFAQGLIGLGLALFYLVWWAAFSLYDLMPQDTAFGLMVATTFGSALLSLRYNAQAIALLALFGGFATPVVLSSGEPHPLIFLGYLALLAGGAYLLARKRDWLALELLAAVGTICLYAGWLFVSARHDDDAIATVFAFVFYAELAAARARGLWFVAQLLGSIVAVAIWGEGAATLPCLLAFAVAGLVVGEVRARHASATWTLACLAFAYAMIVAERAPASPHRDVALLTLAFGLFLASLVVTHVRGRRAFTGDDLALVVANPAAYFAVAYRLLAPADAAYLGLFAVALAAVHLAFARFVWHHAPAPAPAAKERDARPGVLSLGVALTCFALAVPIQCSGFAVNIAWALQGVGLVWLAARYRSDKLGLGGTLLLALSVLALASDSDALADLGLATLANVRFLSFAVIAASMFAAARWFTDRPRALVAYVTAHALVLSGVGLELAGWIARSYPDSRFETTTVAISIWMALYAVGLVVLGVVRHTVIDRVLGLGLLGMVIIKLYLSDVWELGRAFRIAAFLGLGVLLLLVSYLYSRYRGSIEKLWKRDGDAS